MTEEAREEPPWVAHWPSGVTVRSCRVCGTGDLSVLRYYAQGLLCEDHKPGAEG